MPKSSEMNTKPQINLDCLTDLGLIILKPSGVLYGNQTGGYSCTQSSAEGYFVPLNVEGINLEEQIHKYFIGEKWKGCCADGIDEETADFIDQVLIQSGFTDYIKVDRSKLNLSHEAWVYVTIIDPTTRPLDYVYLSDQSLVPFFYLIYGFGNCKGILTWPNSD